MMGGWAEFGTAFVAFMASHVVPARPGVRRRLVAALGERLYLILYAATSLGILGWLIVAAGRAPFVPLWDFALWQIWVPNIAMPLACLLAAFGVGAPNPLSFGGRNGAAFDPEAPGIAGVTRHPLLWALALWSGAHIVPNGDLAHTLLFGAFMLFAVIGMAAIDRRLRQRLGDAEWVRLAHRTSMVPFAALVARRWRPERIRIDLRHLGAAALLYAGLVLLHPTLIGVSPLPLS